MPAGIHPTTPEDSTCFIGVSFFDKEGAPISPAEIYWKIIDVNTGGIIQAEASFSPPNQIIEIEIDDALNAMLDPLQTEELHRLIIRAVFTAGKQFKLKFDFAVERID